MTADVCCSLKKILENEKVILLNCLSTFAGSYIYIYTYIQSHNNKHMHIHSKVIDRIKLIRIAAWI